MIIKKISPTELTDLIQKKSNISIVDIRELYEIENDGKLDMSVHIPMGDLVNKLGDIPPADKIIFHCTSGNRSEKILNFLMMNNLYQENYFTLEGGFSSINKK
jgi:rhodanese-related sulfurtransferase